MSSKFQAGAARISITPSLDSLPRMAGFIYREGPATGVHDDIYASALVLKTQDNAVAIVSIDIIGVSAAFVAEVRTMIEDATGIKGDNVMIAATHTHSAPVFGILKGCGKANNLWLEDVKKNTVKAVKKASDNAIDAKLASGLGTLEGLTYNRHQVLKKDKLVVMPLQKDEDLLKRNIPDYTVRVIRIEGVDGSPISIFSSFSCHPALLDYNNLLISSDYVYYTRETIEKDFGGIAVFATAACGDMNPLNFNTTDDLEKQYKYTKTLGQAVAKEALKIAAGLTPTDQVKLSSVSQIIKAPLYNVPTKDKVEELLKENRELLEKIKNDEATISPSGLIFSKTGQINYQSFYLEYLEECLEKLSCDNVEDQKKVDMEIHVILINEFTIIGVPGEPYVAIAFAIQDKFPNKKCVMLDCANGAEGYIPDKAAHPDGGYTVERAHRFHGQLGAFAPEMEDIIVETAIRLIGS
jgi:neutral ceramidase